MLHSIVTSVIIITFEHKFENKPNNIYSPDIETANKCRESKKNVDIRTSFCPASTINTWSFMSQ